MCRQYFICQHFRKHKKRKEDFFDGRYEEWDFCFFLLRVYEWILPNNNCEREKEEENKWKLYETRKKKLTWDLTK